MLRTKIITGAVAIGIFVISGVSTGFAQSIDQTKPLGFASADGGTTGGAGGTVVAITSPQQLADSLKLREKTSNPQNPVIYQISSMLSPADKIDVKRTKNITIIGMNDNAGFKGAGINIVGSTNIIVRDLTICDATVGTKDGLTVDASNHVWIDHCTFTDSPSSDVKGSTHDGLLDVKNGAAYVTISFNNIYNHRKTCLLGHSAGNGSTDKDLKVTYCYNLFNESFSRNPRVRFAQCHIFNNYYYKVGSMTGLSGETGYAIGITCEAQVLAEGNYFENTTTPVLISKINDPGEMLSGDPAGYISAPDNYLVNSDPIVENKSGFNFNPKSFYSYTLMNAQDVKAYVLANAGAKKITVAINTPPLLSVSPSEVLFSNIVNRNTIPTLSFTISGKSLPVHAAIYSVAGSKIADVLTGNYAQGWHSIVLDLSGYVTGTYICKVAIGKEHSSQRFVINQ